MKNPLTYYERVRVKRNDSWCRSASLGVFSNLYWLPTSFGKAVWPSLKMIAGGVGGLIVGVPAWALARLMVFAFGLIGMISEIETPISEKAQKRESGDGAE